MKKLFLIMAVISGSLLSAAAMAEGPGTDKARKWKLIEETDKITLYERWVSVDEELEVRERKGIFTANCPVDQAVRLITSTELAPTWMKGVSESSVLEQVSGSEWYTYTLYQIPWPFNDRDMVTRLRLEADEEGRTVIYLDSHEGIKADKEGVERLKNFHASWVVEKLSGNTCRVTFVARTDEGPVFPRWIQDPIVKKAFISNLENLSDLLNKSLVQAD